MTKPELGTKRRCNSCATNFFDLNREPIVCPKCAAVFGPPRPDPPRARRPSDRQPLAAHEAAVSEVPNVIASHEGSKVDNDGALPTAEAEEVDEDLLLKDDQDDELDDSQAVDGEIEKDDT